MILAKVVGNVVATIKTKSHENYKILAVKPIDMEGNIKGDTMLALDAAQAGIGDIVLILQEGNSIRIVMKNSSGAVDALVVGVVDYITINKHQSELKGKN